MDALNKLVQVPSWAYDFCYYYLAVAAVIVVYSLYSIVILYSLPSIVQKIVPVTSISIALLLSGAVTVLLTMMQFWICRSALKPQSRVLDAVAQAASAMLPSRGSGTQEGFAVQCSSLSDCTAVMGTPQPSGFCECGERGVCGGCTMQNNMVPSMLPAYSEPLAGGAGPL